jgi:hypothetical protein
MLGLSQELEDSEECFDYDEYRPTSWLRREPFQRFSSQELDRGTLRYLPAEWSPVLQGMTPLIDPVDGTQLDGGKDPLGLGSGPNRITLIFCI